MRSSGSRIIEVCARDSKLSRAQVQEILQEIQTFHPQVEFSCVWVKTRGDLDLKTSLRHLEKTDFFTREVDQLLISGKCRIAIHSAKDLPDPLPHGIRCIALTRGVDPSDSLVLRKGFTLETLPLGARIATSSLRREGMLRKLRPDLSPVDVRGTIERRLQLLEEGYFEGLVVAEAALIRLKLLNVSRLRLFWEPAPLQGRLAILARALDVEIAPLFQCIDYK